MCQEKIEFHRHGKARLNANESTKPSINNMVKRKLAFLVLPPAYRLVVIAVLFESLFVNEDRFEEMFTVLSPRPGGKLI